MSPGEQVEALFPPDGPYNPDLTTGAATSIAGLVRYLNHATAPWKSGAALQYPAHLSRVLANLGDALHDMSQLAEQLAHHARSFGDDPYLYDNRGGDPHETVADVEAELGLFAVGVDTLAATLTRAHEAANRLGIREQT